MFVSLFVYQSCIRRTQYITSIGLFFKNSGFSWSVSECEELEGNQIESDYCLFNEANHL